MGSEVWHVKLSEQIRPWDTLACCWDAEQTNKQTLESWVLPMTIWQCWLSCSWRSHPSSFTVFVLKTRLSRPWKIIRGFPSRMVHLYYISCVRCTILVENPDVRYKYRSFFSLKHVSPDITSASLPTVRCADRTAPAVSFWIGLFFLQPTSGYTVTDWTYWDKGNECPQRPGFGFSIL